MAQQEFDPNELLDTLRAGGDVEVIRQSAEATLQALIEAEATAVIGAGPHERTEDRQNYHNGHRPRLLSTKAGPGALDTKAPLRVAFPRSSSAAAGSTGRCSRS